MKLNKLKNLLKYKPGEPALVYPPKGIGFPAEHPKYKKFPKLRGTMPKQKIK